MSAQSIPAISRTPSDVRPVYVRVSLPNSISLPGYRVGKITGRTLKLIDGPAIDELSSSQLDMLSTPIPQQVRVGERWLVRINFPLVSVKVRHPDQKGWDYGVLYLPAGWENEEEGTERVLGRTTYGSPYLSREDVLKLLAEGRLDPTEGRKERLWVENWPNRRTTIFRDISSGKVKVGMYMSIDGGTERICQITLNNAGAELEFDFHPPVQFARPKPSRG